MSTPADFGAVPGRDVDSTAALQLWLDSRGDHKLDTYYRHDGTLNPRSNTYIEGIGRHKCGLYSPLTTAGKMWAQGISGVTFSNMSFLGDAGTPIGDHVGCYDFHESSDIVFDDCLFLGHRHFVIVASLCNDLVIDDCVFDDWGVREPYTGPPGHREAGTAIFCWQPCNDVAVRNTVLRNGYGIGMWFDAGGRGLTVEDCVVDGASEAGIVGLPRGARVRRNKWLHIRRHDVSGHGCEGQGEDFEYVGNESADCDGAGHYFTDVRHARIEDNRTRQCNQGAPQYLPQSGAYIFRTATADPARAATDVSFCRNVAEPDRSIHACSFVNYSGNPASVVTGFAAHDNDCGHPNEWAGGIVGLYGDPFGARPDAVKGLAIGAE